MKSLHTVLALSVGLAALAQSTGVYAQAAQPAPAAQNNGIPDIVVTARRRAEAQQSVPQTISTVTAADIERKGLRSTEDLAHAIPGINIGGQRRDEAQFNIRGQGPGPITTGQRNFTSVATYFAEVPATVAGPGVFYDLENVQVLKGPQGTLFGRNTTGGAVLFEPHRAIYDNGGYAKFSIGNYGYKEFEGVVNVTPVPDHIAIRLAAQISRRDGYTISAAGQDLDNRRYEAYRATIRLDPSESISSSTIFDYRSKDNNGGSSIFRAVNPNLVLAAPIAIPSALSGILGSPAGATIPLRLGGTVSVACLSVPTLPGCPAGGVVGVFAAAYNGGNNADAANGGFYLLASTATLNATLAQQQAVGIRRSLVTDILRNTALDLGVTNKTSVEASDNLTFRNIIAYRKTRKNEGADYDGTPLPFINNVFALQQPWSTGFNQFTEEFQIQGREPSANFSYILGAYYENVTTGFEQYVGGYTLGSSASSFTARASDFHDTSKALFAHAEWNPISMVGISGGIRQTWDSRKLNFSSLTPTGVCKQTDPATGLITCPLVGNAKFDGLSYDATINIKPMDHVLLYGSFRHGYKSGGINLPAPVAPAPLDPNAYATYGPESVNSFEVGLKADWDIGVPLRTNVSLFYDKYSHMQVGIPSVVASGPPVNVVRNDVRATNKGVEFEGTIVPFHALQISGFVSYLSATPDATYLDGTGAPVVIKGRQLAYQPKWTYGVSGVLTLPVPEDLGKVALSGNWSWRDNVFNTNSPGLSILPVWPSYSLVSARLDWSNIAGKGVDAAVFATNLFNKNYIQGGYPIQQLGFDAAVYGEPRMYGASLTVHFGHQ